MMHIETRSIVNITAFVVNNVTISLMLALIRPLSILYAHWVLSVRRPGIYLCAFSIWIRIFHWAIKIHFPANWLNAIFSAQTLNIFYHHHFNTRVSESTTLWILAVIYINILWHPPKYWHNCWRVERERGWVVNKAKIDSAWRWDNGWKFKSSPNWYFSRLVLPYRVWNGPFHFFGYR